VSELSFPQFVHDIFATASLTFLVRGAKDIFITSKLNAAESQRQHTHLTTLPKSGMVSSARAYSKDTALKNTSAILV
jgi:hypothetical protein